MQWAPLIGWYFRNQAQLAALETQASSATAGENPLLLEWIEANIAIAQRMWPAYANLLGDLNTTLKEVLGGGKK